MAAKAEPYPIGHVIGRLTVTAPPVRRDKYLYVAVRCSCGVEKQLEQGNLRSGRVNSCGCLNRELVKTRATTHGKGGTLIYAVWNAMVQRCHNINSVQYADYGERGITVCDRWRTFEGFYEDMGDRPFEGAMLDRKDNNLGYSKDNCQWVTRAEQNNNTRKNVLFDFRGEKLSLKELAAKTGINIKTLTTRIYKYGMLAEEAATMPIIPPTVSGGMSGNPLLTVTNKRQDGALLYEKDKPNEQR